MKTESIDIAAAGEGVSWQSFPFSNGRSQRRNIQNEEVFLPEGAGGAAVGMIFGLRPSDSAAR